MTDLDKFFQIAENIFNYPYRKAVYYQNDGICQISIFPESIFKLDEIILNNYSELPKIEVTFKDNDWYSADINHPDQINWVIELINEYCDEKVKKALLEGIR